MSLDVVFLTGISGSGKSVAINALEDAGYFCVDISNCCSTTIIFLYLRKNLCLQQR